MYNVNFKVIVLIFFFQMLAAVAWFYLAPFLLPLNEAILDNLSQHSLLRVSGLFVCSTFLHVFFVAWLLMQVRGTSAFGRFFLVIGIWLFIVLPNYVVLNLYSGLSLLESVYLLSYGALNCLVIALILPFGRSFRSIFKD